MQTEKEYTAAREISALRCESVGEYSLPDYNGDVKKVLTVKTSVFPSGKFVGDGTLEISGTVGYNVVYVDGENNVTHAEFSTDYDAAIRINSDIYVDSDVHTSVSSYNVRLVGPRKFSVKATLDSDVCISEKKSHSIEGDAFMEYEPEFIGESVNVLSVDFATSEPRDIEEEMVSLDGAIADEIEILLSDVDSCVQVAEKTESSVALRGDIGVRMMYKNADGAPVNVEKKIPYSDEVYLEGAGDYDSLYARLEVMSLKSTLLPTEDGVKISCSVCVAPRVCAKRNTSLDLVSDAYLKERGTVNEYSDFNYTEFVCAQTAEAKIEDRRSLSELELEGACEVVYTDATVRCEGYEVVDNALRIRGEVRFNGVVCQRTDEESTIYVPVKISATFEQNVNVNCQIHDNMHIVCHASVDDVRMEIDANHIMSYATVTVSVSISADKKRRCLSSSYVTDEEYVRDASVVTVYYPDASESLFEIARKYHTSTRAVAEVNRLTEAVFSSSGEPLGTLGIGKLIIK